MADKEKKEETTINDPIKEFLANSSSGGGFVKFDETNIIEGMYVGCTIEDDPFNPGMKRMSYDLDIQGERRSLMSASKRLAEATLKANPIPGDFVRFTREPGATQYDTTYKVETSPEGIPF